MWWKNMQVEGLHLNNNILSFNCVVQDLWSSVHLKARFGILKWPMDINIVDLPNVIYACFFLHNFCEFNSDSMSEETVQSAISYD